MDAGKRTLNVPPAPGAAEVPRRDWWRCVKRGFAGHCPACGKGRLFGRFLKVNDHCPHCGEVLHHHRADDLPPYLVILVVGHVVVAGILAAEQASDWPIWLHMLVWPVLVVVLSLALIQPVKGAVVGLQWALGMHGFSSGGDDEAFPRSKGGRHEQA